MIHRPDALALILAAIGSRLGALALLPVHPTIGASAHRLLVSGVKGSKAPLRLAPALVLHGADGRLTARRTPSIAASASSTGAAERNLQQIYWVLFGERIGAHPVNLGFLGAEPFRRRSRL